MINEILGIEPQDAGTKVLKLVDVNEAKDQIYKAVMEAVPKKLPLVISTSAQEPREFMNSEREIKVNMNHQAIGHNQAIDEMTANINKFFGKGE